MAILTLPADLTVTGMDQKTMHTFLTNVVSLINELQTDHATNKTAIDETKTLTDELRADHATYRTEVIAIGTTLADVKAIYDAHTHECPGSSFAASRCSLPDTGAAENSLAASVASAITDTSGSSVPATITAAEATAGAATLTNSTALTLLKG